MAVDRKLWTSPFRNLPRWRCPTCADGDLTVRNKLFIEETEISKKERDNSEWDPDWIVERFCGFLDCSNPGCGELVTIAGTSGAAYYVEENIDGELYDVVEQSLIPLHIHPAPHLFPLSQRCPESVKFEIISGFEMIWSDFESCANKFRIAVELLLTDRKIPTYYAAVKGKPRRQINLHMRIQKLKLKNKEAAELLEAIKWLGNHGSHSHSKLTLENVFFAAELIEHVIQIIYDPTDSNFKKAKKINKKKGPI